MKSEETWRYIHSERAALAKTLTGLSAEQWAAPSWCDGWSIQDAAGHVLTAAEQTPFGFYKQMAAAGFKFDIYSDRAAKRLSALGPDELIRRLEARTTTTNRPPAPVVAMLGEIVVHGEDIRRPLQLEHEVPEPALVAVAENYKKTNLLIGAKRRIAGLQLQATDIAWGHGAGPQVSGRLIDLILAMCGRVGALGALTGDGVEVLRARSA